MHLTIPSNRHHSAIRFPKDPDIQPGTSLDFKPVSRDSALCVFFCQGGLEKLDSQIKPNARQLLVLSLHCLITADQDIRPSQYQGKAILWWSHAVSYTILLPHTVSRKTSKDLRLNDCSDPVYRKVPGIAASARAVSSEIQHGTERRPVAHTSLRAVLHCQGGVPASPAQSSQGAAPQAKRHCLRTVLVGVFRGTNQSICL